MGVSLEFQYSVENGYIAQLALVRQYKGSSTTQSGNNSSKLIQSD